MSQTNCDELVREATKASKHSLHISAGIFEDAAKCYDRIGDRRKAGQYLMLAGDFFIDLDNKEKAATCYGKAIMRHLMIDDITTAEILFEKGREYGFSSSTHQYRIALDTLDRQKIGKIEEEITKEVEVLPDIDILPIEEEQEEELIILDTDLFFVDEEIPLKKQEFFIPQLEKEETSTLSSFAVLAAVSQATRKKTSQEIKTNAVIKNVAGESQLIEPQLSIKPLKLVKSPIDIIKDSVHVRSADAISTDTTEIEDDTKEEEITTQPLITTDTLELDYTAKTEIINEFEDELVDIEIVNTIPFNFEVVNVITDFELDEKKRTSDGLVFTWKKDRIDPGERISVEYILRKRVERSIILRKENKVSVINLYQSVKQELIANLDFVNTSGKVFHEILIEDVIPPELIVNQIDTNKKIKPVTIPTHDSTLYRWIFSILPPGDNFSVFYKFREKPLTRHYKDEIEFDTGVISIEKISQPVLDSVQSEYLCLYTITNPTSNEILLNDRIPSDYSIILVDPTHLNPSIKKEKHHQLLSWELSPDEVLSMIILRIRGSESFTPLAPFIELKSGEKYQLVERSSSSEKKLINIRRLRDNMMESV